MLVWQPTLCTERCNRFCISCKRLRGLTSASVSYSFSFLSRNSKILFVEHLILCYFNINYDKVLAILFSGSSIIVKVSKCFKDHNSQPAPIPAPPTSLAERSRRHVPITCSHNGDHSDLIGAKRIVKVYPMLFLLESHKNFWIFGRGSEMLAFVNSFRLWAAPRV